MAGDRLTALHLEAGIAACHAAADDFEATDWPAILGYYDRLLALAPTPVRALNRIVALAMVSGPAVALTALADVAEDATLADYYLLPATRGELLRRAGQPAEARQAWQQARTLATAEPVRRLLQARMDGLPA